MKKILSTLLTVCMALTLLPTVAFAGTVTNYGIWVGPTEVTSENADNVTGSGITGTVIYDSDSNTLTLNGATITETGLYGYVIGSHPGNLNIALIGSNTIDLSGVEAVNGSFIGIYSTGKVNIKSTVGGRLSIVNAPTTRDANIGILGSAGVTIEDCAVTVTAGTVTGTDNNACLGIEVANGILSIKNAAITASGGTTEGLSHGISVDNGSLVIDNSTVTASGGAGAFKSCGIDAATTSITISASTVTAAGNTSALYFGGAPTATGLAATASTDKTGDGAASVTFDGNVYGQNNTYKYVQISPVTPTSQARWGVAGSEGAAPTDWTQGTLADAISYANSSSGTYIQLLTDIDNSNHSTWPLTFDRSKTTILDLNGKDIDRGLTAASTTGNVITVNGPLTIKDGSTTNVSNQGHITGGYNSGDTGGGVYVLSSFTLQSGNITDNKSASGGGVMIADYCTFNMQGGSIAGNEAASSGGAVYTSQGTFTMTGGSITGNQSADGGVYYGKVFWVSGRVVIKGNTLTSSSVERNVVVPTGKRISINPKPLTDGASIGVTAKSVPAIGSPVDVAYSIYTSNYSAYFFSDNSSYIIQNGTDNVVQLAVGPVTISPLTISDSFTAGHNLTLNDLNSYKPSITQNDESALITEQGWQTSNGLGEWTKWSEGFIPLDTSGTYKLRYYVDYTGSIEPTTVYSNEVTLNVVGTTTLSLTASPASPQGAGTQVTLTATLTGFFSGPGVSGQTITFKSGSTTLGTASLNSSGVADYIWTPGSAGTYSLTAAYAATDYNTAATSSALSYTVNAVLPTAAAYAAASPAAVSGTDYVLNDTNKTLTINTDKGAAFWSASGTTYLEYTILLANDVDVGGFRWTPVGDSSPYFTGTFDGQGHSITGLKASADSYAGLFSLTNRASIKNLCISGNVQISNSSYGSSGGALVAYATASTIANCCSHTDVIATYSGTAGAACAGGLVGIASSATTITNCLSTGRVSATAPDTDGSRAYAGGIAGDNSESNIINCYSTGSVTAVTASERSAGGVVGRISNDDDAATATNCYYLSGTADKGIGKIEAMGRDSALPEITGCGTFDSSGALTAGTAEQFISAQTLTYTGALLKALNGWVINAASADYRTWQADSENTNGGYPALGAVWAPTASLDLTGVGCDVAAGKLTGTTTNMQYSLDGGSTWQDCVADNTVGLTFAVGTVKVRQKDKTTNERTVITIAAPASSNAPTLESKASNSVTLTAMAGYEYSKDGGVTWQDSNSFSGLSSNTAYSFVVRIKATATTLPGTVNTAVAVTTSSAPSGGGTGSSSGSSTSGTGAPVIVDGKAQNIGTVKKSGDTTTVTVDQSKLGTNIGGAAAGSSVVVPVNGNSMATASLVVKNIEDMAQKGMTLTVQTGNVAYNLNTSAIDTAALTAAFPGADRSKVPFDVTITNSSVSVAGETLVLSPVAFTVTATYGGKTVDVDTFSAYIDRVIEVTKEQAAKITTAVVVVNADGSTRHVPTNVIEKDGKYYAVINSRTNSTYALIENNVTFADAAGKWYEAAVNEMGSRKIIAGRSASVFDGDASITRAEFVVILVRALGLPADGTSGFSDVPAGAWYDGAVATAVQYGLTAGKNKNRFDPNANITRQEAMLMLKRAAALTEFTGTSSDLDSFADTDSVGSWAKDAVQWNVGSGLIQGTHGKLNPTADITRAQSATIILRLLQKAELVDVRS